jgi:predicted DNA-binding transcriptional regulator AlpA
MADQTELNPDKVLSLRELDQLLGTSPATRKRIFAAGEGPPIIQLSARRRGVRVRDYQTWLNQRTVPSNQA